MCAKSLQLCVTLCDPMDYIAFQAPLSMEFSRQEHWSGLPFPSLGDLPDPGIKPVPLISPSLTGRLFTTSTTSVQFNSVALVRSGSLRPYGLQPTRLLFTWDSPGKNTRVGCRALFQRIFQTQGSNPCLLHWQADSLPLSHQGSPGIYFFTSHALGNHCTIIS